MWLALLGLPACQTSLVRPSGSPQERWHDPSATPPSDAQPILSEWWETVSLENEDRKNRLKRLAAVMPSVEAPEFYQYDIPKHQLGDLPVDIPVLRLVFTERIFFDPGQSVLRPEAQPVIDLVAESLRREPPDVAIFVAGHTDTRGSEDYNYNLSVDRANAVAKALADRGIGRTHIWRVGFGEAVPLRNNDTPERMAMNRRVEFLFAAKAKAAAVWLSQQAENPCTAATTTEAQSCKRKLKQSLKVVAIPIIKDRNVNIPAIPTPGAVIADNVRRHLVDIQKAPGIQASASKPGVAVDIDPGDPIVIDLDNNTYHIPAPQI